MYAVHLVCPDVLHLTAGSKVPLTGTRRRASLIFFDQ